MTLNGEFYIVEEAERAIDHWYDRFAVRRFRNISESFGLQYDIDDKFVRIYAIIDDDNAIGKNAYDHFYMNNNYARIINSNYIPVKALLGLDDGDSIEYNVSIKILDNTKIESNDEITLHLTAAQSKYCDETFSKVIKKAWRK